MLLSVLICGIICCLGLHYIIRCAFTRSSSFMISEPISKMNLPGVGEECVICLSDFVSGEQLRLLPKCNHGFHIRCIEKWLKHHLTCPKCRHCLDETCQKILGDFSQADSVATAPTESVIVRVGLLEPSSAQAFQEQFLGSFVSRKLLLHNPFDHNTQQAFAVAPSPLITHENNLSGHVLMLLSVLVCGIICCLGLHYIIHCASRRSSRYMISEPEMNLPGVGEECVICLSDFVSGEQLRLLPKCNHGFHVRCIDKWLQHHLTCPNCRHCLVDTCQKILGDFSQADSVAAAPIESVIESVIVRIAPLEPEGRVNTFREIN